MDWCSPAACTLDPAAQPERMAEWDALFATAARSVRPVEGGVCVDLAPAPGRAAPIGLASADYWWRLTSTDTSR